MRRRRAKAGTTAPIAPAGRRGARTGCFAITAVIEHAGWRRVPGLLPRLRRAAAAVADHLPQQLRLNGHANLLLTGDAALRRLNRDFRGMDKPTNVLSFPQYAPRDLPKNGKGKQPVELGDIAIAYQYIVVEAKETHKILINHCVHLLIHGLLHLLGYDHLSGDEAAAMERLERKIMSSLDLPDPYDDAPQPASRQPPRKHP